MTEVEADRLVGDYLTRLDTALSGLPEDRRSQLVSEIAEHISMARKRLVNPTEADIMNLLDRVGTPEAIAAEAAGEMPPPVPARPGGIQEFLAIVLLLFGGFLFGVGWLVGVALLWTSRVWRVREKILGTLVIPGGLATALLLGGWVLTVSHSFSCAGGAHSRTPCVTTLSRPLPEAAGIVLLAGLIVVPVVVAVHLYRVAKKPGRVDPRTTARLISAPTFRG